MFKHVSVLTLLFALTFAVACGEEEGGAPDQAAAPSGEEAMTAAADEFLAAFGEGDAEGSFALLAPSAQEKLGGLENWANVLANGAQDETLPANWNFTSASAGDSAGTIAGTVETKGEKTLGLTMQKTADGWVVAGFSIE